MTLWKWSQTPATNATADATINWAEGQAPSSVNDSARAMMAAVAKWRDDIGGVNATTGGPVAFLYTSSQGLPATPNNGTAITFFMNVTNGAAATLRVDSGTAFPLQTGAGVAAPAGILVQNNVYTATFNTSALAWVLNNVYNAPIPANTITNAMLQANCVQSANILNGTIVASDIAAGTVTGGAGGNIAASTITTSNMFADTGNKGKVLGYDYSTGAVSALAYAGGPLLHVREQQTAGSNSTSTLTLNAWARQALTTALTNEITGATLATNQISLPAGTYWAQGHATAYLAFTGSSASLKSRLRDVTNNVTAVVGFSSNSFNQTGGEFDRNDVVPLAGRFTLAGTATLELQMWNGTATATVSRATTGAHGELEIYANLMIWRIA